MKTSTWHNTATDFGIYSEFNSAVVWMWTVHHRLVCVNTWTPLVTLCWKVVGPLEDGSHHLLMKRVTGDLASLICEACFLTSVVTGSPPHTADAKLPQQWWTVPFPKLQDKVNPPPLICFFTNSRSEQGGKWYRKPVWDSCAITVVSLTMWFSKTWSWFAGGMWKCLEPQTRKALGCCAPILVEASDSNLEARVLTGMQSAQRS